MEVNFEALNIQNNLTTDTEGSALDATQGKNLDGKKLDKSAIIDGLTATIKGFALDATQGKVLDDKITQTNADLSETTETVDALSDELTLEQETTITSSYLSVPITLKRKGNIVTVDLNAAKQLHSWAAGTTQIYTTTPTGFAPISTARLPLYKDRSVIGYLSITSTSGVYVNSASAVNDGSASFTSSGCYVAE